MSGFLKANNVAGQTRAALATIALRTTGFLSRAAGIGSGSTIGGRVGLLIDPDLLGELGAGRDIVLVTGTNGKTTTTRLIVEALGGPGKVASSGSGANLPPGLASALAAARRGQPAVLEVDERYLGAAAAALDPQVIVLLNVSRDQLDRMSEVRMIAERWRTVLGSSSATVVANADDPLVVHAAGVGPPGPLGGHRRPLARGRLPLPRLRRPHHLRRGPSERRRLALFVPVPAPTP